MRTTFLMLFAFSFALLASAQTDKKPTKLEEQSQALLKEFGDEQDPLINPKVNPKTAEERKKLTADLKECMNKYSDKFLALAKSDPKDDHAFTVSTRAFSIGSNAQKGKVVEFWLEHCADNPKVIDTLAWTSPYTEFADYGDKLAAKTKNTAIRGMAKFSAAASIIENLERRPGGMFDDGKTKPVPVAERIKRVDEATKQLQAVVKEYGNEKIKDRDNKDITLAEAAKPVLHLAENLALGRTAPDFEAESLIDGKKHKLSDYRGKIVILDFYYYSGGYTHDRHTVLPRLRLTTAKFEGKPVQILSIGLDEKKENTKKLFEKEKLSWPQLWDGDKNGLAKTYQAPWQTQSTPYILDGKGVIRAKHKWGVEVDAVVVDLLKELEKK